MNKKYRFNPKQDITAWELAYFLARFKELDKSLIIMDDKYESIPKNVARHLALIESKPHVSAIDQSIRIVSWIIAVSLAIIGFWVTNLVVD